MNPRACKIQTVFALFICSQFCYLFSFNVQCAQQFVCCVTLMCTVYGIGGERLSHMGYSMRCMMSEELHKKQGAVKVLDAECAWMRQITEAVFWLQL